MIYKIAIVDDHKLFAKSVETLINSFEEFQVVYHAYHGNQLIEKLSTQVVPDLILLDINMPVRNGLETMEWLKENKIPTRVLALSMDDSEDTIISMLYHGARGYILKDINPSELKEATLNVLNNGFHYSEKATGSLLQTLQNSPKNEIEFKDW